MDLQHLATGGMYALGGEDEEGAKWGHKESTMITVKLVKLHMGDDGIRGQHEKL